MSKLTEYFQTDWANMTATDWFGLLLTVVIFILMFGMYFWALRPKNKEKLESHRILPLHEDETEAENNDGRQ